MRRFAIGIVLSCLSALAVAAGPAEIVKKLIGYEYTATRDALPGLGGCVDEGGRSLNDEFVAVFIRCGKDYFLALEESEASSLPSYRIVDAIALPEFDFYFESDDNRQIWPDGPCELKGRRGVRMEVLLRWGKRERVTSKNGVLAAWKFDLKKGKIFPLDISRIVCEQPDEP